MSYESSSPKSPTEPAPAPAPAPQKKKREGVKMTDKQKKDLNKHMEKHKKDGKMSASEMKSHRMKMMSRMRKGMSVNKAHKDITQ
jgi:predicted secreted Zn-dependent protease